MSKPVPFHKDGYIAEIVFNRPEIHNAYNMEMVEQLGQILLELKEGRGGGDDLPLWKRDPRISREYRSFLRQFGP